MKCIYFNVFIIVLWFFLRLNNVFAVYWWYFVYYFVFLLNFICLFF